MSKYSDNMPPDIKGAIGWLLKYVEEGKSLLDVGCSTGYFGSFIASNRSVSVDGVEISDDAEVARKKLRKVFRFDIEKNWPAEVKKYDYILFGDVLEHVKMPEDVLQRAAKKLKPNGLIFVSIPNIAHISIRLELMTGSFIYEPMGILDNTHLQYFTKDTFIEKAKIAGFSARLVDYTSNDIPREIITKYLKQLGLQPTPRFWKITEKQDARAYQYKFILTKGSVTKQINKNITKPLQYSVDYISNLNNQIDSIHKHADEQAKIISYYKEQSEALEAQNASLKEDIAKQEKTIAQSLQIKIKKQAKRAKTRIRGK